ncbi:T9SS sorting signal type C domain-containing protein [Flavobacterium polysaccharolyticum]|uniref:T9SS sorting signal type C domain-containing protein n=1 Tax=Flavobacterium polysaccharolyticum TaxID=3133148 RepID=A0ABU9NND9_9FLAO
MIKKLFFNKLNAKCCYWLWLLFLPVLGTAQALSGTYIISASQPAPFNSITNAITRINTSGVTGPVTFLLDDATYSASETFPIVINAFTGASAVNTLTIKPNAGKTVLVQGNNNPSSNPLASVFDLNGADYVVFDGNNGSVNKALTVYNNSTLHYAEKTVFWLRGGASFNQFKNLNVRQNFDANSNLSLGLFAGGTSISTSSNGNNPNTTIDNVNFVDVKHLLYVNGTDATGNANWTVNNNTNSSTSAANKPFTGLFLTNTSNFTISNNLLSNFSETNFSYGNFPFAGAIAVTANNGSVSNNQINDVISTIAKTAFGIYLSGNDITVANNVVSNVASTGGGGTDTQNGFGIIVASGNNAKIYYNSVRLGVNQTSGVSAPIYVDSNCNTLDIRNNIFVNAQTSGGTRVAFYSEGQDTSKFLNLDYNNYQSTQHIGSWGDYYNSTNLKTTLANWRTATAKETNAQNITPDFVSTTTLRLQQTSNNATLQGVAIATVVTDIDGENRSRPYMGVDELSCTVTTTSFGTTQTICYNREVISPNVGGVTFSAVPFNRYVTLNVIQGLQYRIATSASDIGLVKKITLYNNASPVTGLGSSSASSTTSSASLDWTASFTGVLRIEFTATNCQTNANTDTVTATFIGGSNTVDNANAAGTNSWIGHVYDFSNDLDIVPMPPSDANAFANYLGNFTQTNTVSGSTISLAPNYGGDNTCYSFTAGGTTHSFRTDTFAVRYRMNTTAAVYPAGCYFVNITGDDGVRLYIDGTLVLNSWRQQSPTPYNNVLVYLNGSSQLVFDYYEKNGQNVSTFTIRPASTSITSLNTIITSGPISRCVSTTTFLDGSVVATKGNNTIDPVKYQWQSSTDNSNWTNISGGTAEDYTVPATNPSTSTVIYYRRNVFGSTASSAACIYSTASIAITTNPSVSAPTVGTITNVTCSSTTGSVVLNGLPSGSWTINQSGTNSTSYSSSGSSYTVTGLAVGGYTFTVSRGGCTSSPTPNVPIADASSTTWNGSSWSNGVPDTTKNIIVSSVNPSSPFTANLTGCSLAISTGVTAIVPSGVTLTITNSVITNGQLIFENNASLVQTTNATNIGAIEYRRISSPMKNFDFTYWSSPVTGQNIVDLSPNTLADKYFRFSGSANDWVFYNGTMVPGLGYIIRTPKPGIYGAPYPETVVMPYSQPVAFKGVPNNGNYPFAVGPNELNLIGNPYPSAIRADDFINANSAIINGALYFWTHNTAITNNTYTADDYASYTLAGGTGTSKAPSTGLGGTVPDGFIAAGQSFFVENSIAGSFQFTNAMRVAGNNSQFFKQANTQKTAAVEKNRVWLNLTNSGGAFKQLLVGYITGATNDWDNLYDGPTFDGQEFVDFYSVNQGKNLTIQGRALPFLETDIVPLGYRSTISGAFDISIDNRDGALAGQEIWLEDKKTNTLHELTKGKYTFTAINGVENDRFVLKYTNKTLGTDDNEVADKSFIVSVKNKKITLTSSAEAITQVQVFDLLGRKVYDKSKINAQEWSISNLPSSEQTLIVKTTLANGAITNKKIIY